MQAVEQSVFILVAWSPISSSSFAHALFKYLQLPPDAWRLGIRLSPFSHLIPLTFRIVKFKQREMAFVSSLKGLRQLILVLLSYGLQQNDGKLAFL